MYLRAERRRAELLLTAHLAELSQTATLWLHNNIMIILLQPDDRCSLICQTVKNVHMSTSLTLLNHLLYLYLFVVNLYR